MKKILFVLICSLIVFASSVQAGEWGFSVGTYGLGFGYGHHHHGYNSHFDIDVRPLFGTYYLPQPYPYYGPYEYRVYRPAPYYAPHYAPYRHHGNWK